MSVPLTRRFFRLFLYVLFAVGTVIVAGSLSPERIVLRPVEHAAQSVVLQMTEELPVSRQDAWKLAAQQDPVTLFRLSQSLR